MPCPTVAPNIVIWLFFSFKYNFIINTKIIKCMKLFSTLLMSLATASAFAGVNQLKMAATPAVPQHEYAAVSILKANPIKAAVKANDKVANLSLRSTSIADAVSIKKAPAKKAKAEGDVVEIEATEYAVEWEYYAESADWYCAVNTGEYLIRLDAYSDNDESPVGVYGPDDFDYNYTWGSHNGIQTLYESVNATVTEGAMGYDLDATIVTDEGETLHVVVKPQPHEAQEIVIENGVLTSAAYYAYDEDWWVKFTDVEGIVSVALDLINPVEPGVFAGSYTEDDILDNYTYVTLNGKNYGFETLNVTTTGEDPAVACTIEGEGELVNGDHITFSLVKLPPIEPKETVQVNATLDKIEFGTPSYILATENVAAARAAEGKRCIIVKATDMVTAAWDNQFWIVANEALHAGDAVSFKAEIKAAHAASVGTQYHVNAGEYLHWAAVGNFPFTEEWAEYTFEGTVPAEADGAKSIAFNLNDEPAANDYYFANISFVVNGVEMVNNGDLSGDDVSSFVQKIAAGGLEPAVISEEAGEDEPVAGGKTFYIAYNGTTGTYVDFAPGTGYSDAAGNICPVDNGTLYVEVSNDNVVSVTANLVCADSIAYVLNLEKELEVAGQRTMVCHDYAVTDLLGLIYYVYGTDEETGDEVDYVMYYPPMEGDFTEDGFFYVYPADGSATINGLVNKAAEFTYDEAGFLQFDGAFLGTDMVDYTVHIDFVLPEIDSEYEFVSEDAELNDLTADLGAAQISGYDEEGNWLSFVIDMDEFAAGHYTAVSSEYASYCYLYLAETGESLYVYTCDLDITVDEAAETFALEGTAQCGSTLVTVKMYGSTVVEDIDDEGSPYDDPDNDLDEEFALETITEFEVDADNGYAYLQAIDGERIFATLIYIDGDELPAGTYEINDTYEVGSVQPGMVQGNVYPTFFCANYNAEEGSLYLPLWLCVSGTVEVSYDAAGNVSMVCDAVNTWGRTAHIVVNKTTTGIENVAAAKSANGKFYENNSFVIRNNGAEYNAFGQMK